MAHAAAICIASAGIGAGWVIAGLAGFMPLVAQGRRDTLMVFLLFIFPAAFCAAVLAWDDSCIGAAGSSSM